MAGWIFDGPGSGMAGGSMRTYTCTCGQTLFCDNNVCLKCGSELGFCPACQKLGPIFASSDGTYRCGNPECGAALVKCANYVDYDVCNRCIEIPKDGSPPPLYCDCCRYNQTIPDLSVPGNLQKWYRLESAKRRLFYDLALLGLPHGTAADGFVPPLSFDFKADIIPSADFWRSMGDEERVYTGHQAGKITINIREADEVERERLRVDMGEAHRTLIGHFRHEIGHYYWELLIRGQREAEFTKMFGDPWNPSYAEAMEVYYAQGPRPHWQRAFPSAYASMHPWEDWAESFALLLDMISALETATWIGFLPPTEFDMQDMDKMITLYQRLGLGLNEMSRTMGLLDIVPEVLVEPVARKIRFVYNVCRNSRGGSGS